MINGALDGAVAAWLADPTYDLTAATEQVVAAVLRMVDATG